MDRSFNTDAHVPRPALARACGCPLHARRLFTGGLLGAGLAAALPAAAVTIPECKRSTFTKAVSADTVEQQAGLQYRQMLQKAGSERALAPADHPQLQRLKYIGARMVPFTRDCNDRAAHWQWEINLIGSRQINAFCMPGGKIAFYFGILQQLQLNDDEVAMIMGHEAAHALREHARERMGKTAATRIGASALSALLGLGNTGDTLLNMGSQLLTLKFSREDESEADLIGIELAARAGYDPGAGVTLWQKMAEASKGAPPQFMSTHPSGPTRINDIQNNLPKVQPLYERAPRPPQRYAPPPKKG